jgi:prepilin-type N-terminal cleavage/methylation domain-containing protein
MAPQNRRRPSRYGFTLVELLVVIGIIVVLIGILLPVVTAVQKSARAADSLAAISNLAKSIERYRQDFGAYPGAIRTSAFSVGTDGKATSDGPDTLGGMTMTENMVLSLVGGWEPGNPGQSGAFIPSKVGSGPMTHTPVITARKRFTPYADAVPGNTIQTAYGPSGTWNRTAVSELSDNTYYSVDRNDIPEFMDRFPDQMPIIYLRAQPGAPNYNASGKMDGTTQYNPDHLFPYVSPDVNPATGRINGTSRSRVGSNANSSFPGYSSPPTRDFPSVEAYFRNPGVGPDTDPKKWEVRQKDGFWLIGPGPDRKYGTKDDQTNFGPL